MTSAAQPARGSRPDKDEQAGPFNAYLRVPGIFPARQQWATEIRRYDLACFPVPAPLSDPGLAGEIR